MKKILVILISGLFLAVSCCKDKLPDIQKDDNGVIIKTPYIWKKSLHNGYDFNSNSNFDLAVYYNGNILIPTTNGPNKRQMTLLNPENGDFIWSWDDTYQPETEDIYTYYVHIHNNLLVYQNGDRSYCINLDNGTTHWKTRRSSSFNPFISGINENYFLLGNAQSVYHNYNEQIVYKGDINLPNIQEFIIPDFTIDFVAPGNRIGDVTRIKPYNYNNTQYLVIIWQEPKNVTSIYDWQSYLALYNYNTNQWIYKKKIINQPNINGGILSPIRIYDDKVYMNVGKELFCHDIMTGNQIWSRQFPQDFMFSGFIIEDDKIIANNEDTYTYCLNPQNGTIIWKTKSAGTSGRMSYLNGIVYFVGGSTGKLHAIDINTGKHVWKLDANLFEDNSQGTRYFKTNAVYVFEAEGNKPARVIALSHYYAYCFEAYR